MKMDYATKLRLNHILNELKKEMKAKKFGDKEELDDEEDLDDWDDEVDELDEKLHLPYV